MCIMLCLYAAHITLHVPQLVGIIIDRIRRTSSHGYHQFVTRCVRWLGFPRYDECHLCTLSREHPDQFTSDREMFLFQRLNKRCIHRFRHNIQTNISLRTIPFANGHWPGHDPNCHTCAEKPNECERTIPGVLSIVPFVQLWHNPPVLFVTKHVIYMSMGPICMLNPKGLNENQVGIGTLEIEMTRSDSENRKFLL